MHAPSPGSERRSARAASLRAFCLGLAAASALFAASRLLGSASAGAAAPNSAPRPATSAATASADAAELTARGAALPRSVYPAKVAEQPGVAALCEALHTLPRTRRAECAGQRPGLSFAAECTRTLSAALGSSAVRLDAAAAARCSAAMHARYADCAFSAAKSLPALPECSALAQGTLASGARCRSSLECEAGSHCLGVSPLDTGTCAAPQADGARCQLAIDALASYLPSRPEDHPECRGRCAKGRCTGSASP